MTQLQIKLHQPQAQGFVESGAMAAVRWLSDIEGKRVKPSWSREKPIDISGGNGSQGKHTEFDLPGGGYYGVDITRPRGQGISREFFLKNDEVRTETIELDVSPHEYLGWQQYAGIVPPHPGQAPTLPLFRRFKVRDAPTLVHDLTSSLIGYLFKGPWLRRLEMPSVRGSAVPDIFLAATPPSSKAAWASVGAHSAPSSWIGGPRVDWAPRVDSEFAAWMPAIPDSNESLRLIDGLRVPYTPQDSRFPRWLAFKAGNTIHLASVPWAWWGAEGRNQEDEIRFLYDRLRPSPAEREVPGRLTITVQDRRWFGLVEFLASGRLSLTGGMSDELFRMSDPEEALEAKVKGPLAAVCGGIVLIARAKSPEPERWDRWLENLSNWFPGIPDGPILLGYRRLQQATKRYQLVEAFRHLSEAIQRGIPFFAASIRMLVLALAQIGDEIPEADEWRRFIAPVSTRVDPDQPFTVIRLSSTVGK